MAGVIHRGIHHIVDGVHQTRHVIFCNFPTVVKVIKREDPLLTVVILHRNGTLQVIQTDAFFPGSFGRISKYLPHSILRVQVLQVAFTALSFLWRKSHL